ncbi:YicC/YloC family endoribonuclease [Falsihalocynthiibacter sp. SS001]|uniref:YicC/YloC family endoribonuclease n=1 Tax=Falsihalocynthiibacter sp. SS001 TaxID=3349698 RepID=UPI0036D227C3
MTSFATHSGGDDLYEWVWEMRGVNARGLDIRPRVPDWIIGLDQEVKSKVSSEFSRGSIQLSLKINRTNNEQILTINKDALKRTVLMVKSIENVSRDHNLTLSGVTALDLISQKGVQETNNDSQDTTQLKASILRDLDILLKAFAKMRANEGAVLGEVLEDQLDQIEELTNAAAKEAEARKDVMAQTFKDNVAKILDNSEGLDEHRIAQELAILAVKSDVTEEIDRLHAHVAAARDLLDSDTPVGRKLDFLSQEFNREANTLCSKAQAVTLTRIGLDLKAVIDQMREQVQNVE